MDLFKHVRATDLKPPIPKKTDEMCEVDGCFEKKAPGQNHVCAKHVRSN